MNNYDTILDFICSNYFMATFTTLKEYYSCLA